QNSTDFSHSVREPSRNRECGAENREIGAPCCADQGRSSGSVMSNDCLINCEKSVVFGHFRSSNPSGEPKTKVCPADRSTIFGQSVSTEAHCWRGKRLAAKHRSRRNKRQLRSARIFTVESFG